MINYSDKLVPNSTKHRKKLDTQKAVNYNLQRRVRLILRNHPMSNTVIIRNLLNAFLLTYNLIRSLPSTPGVTHGYCPIFAECT